MNRGKRVGVDDRIEDRVWCRVNSHVDDLVWNRISDHVMDLVEKVEVLR